MNLETDMKRDMVTISDNGTVRVPANVQMRDFEIAELFGVMIPTVKGKIRQILNEGVCVGDFSTGGIVVGNTVLPEYHGLDMVVAMAFRIQSYKAELFRQWIIRKMMQSNTSSIYIGINEIKGKGDFFN